MTMDLVRFEQIIDAYGADPRRWPDAERTEAGGFLAGSEAARERVAQEAALDAVLDAVPSPIPSDLLAARILRAAPKGRSLLDRVGWASGAGWAAAAAAGLVLGLSVGNQAVSAWQADTVLEQASVWSMDEMEYLG